MDQYVWAQKLQMPQESRQKTMELDPRSHSRQTIEPVEHLQPSSHRFREGSCPRECSYSVSHRGGREKRVVGMESMWGTNFIGFCELQRLVHHGQER